MSNRSILLIQPPMSQLNMPYPATAYLKSWINHTHSTWQATQCDLSILLFTKLFSKDFLVKLESALSDQKSSQLQIVNHFLKNAKMYQQTVEPVVQFLQGKNPTLAYRITNRNFLPEGPRFQSLSAFRLPEDQWRTDIDDLAHAFGGLGLQDRAKHLASLYIDDLADLLSCVDPEFKLARYGEKLAASQPSFNPLLAELTKAKPTLIDQACDELAAQTIEQFLPKSDHQNVQLVALSVPFPGNVYGAFRIAAQVRRLRPQAKIILGGGYVNTELRSLSDPRVFDWVDYITYDDGEKPLSCLLEYFEGNRTEQELFRTRFRTNAVQFVTDSREHDVPFKNIQAPSYEGLPLGQYVQLLEVLNPMHRIWSDGRWNKLMLSHGCYWKKCNFCDVNLDYIGRYDPQSFEKTVDRMEALIAETGQTGFHFVDEAAPPAVLKGLAQEIIRRGLSVTWWGNIRFEKSFTFELTQLLADSGCIAVSGGLEVASDRLLKLMNKGVSVEQVAGVTHAFSRAGVLVHAYLMYGFPTQTLQETIDSLERVRQLFEMGCIQSGFWHRFSATIHSPIGKKPDAFQIRLIERESVSFAENDLPFEDPLSLAAGLDAQVYSEIGLGLNKALFNYMNGTGLELDVRKWFNIKVPKAKVASRLIEQSLEKINRKK